MDGDDGDDSEETNEENELPVQYSRKNPSSSFSIFYLYVLYSTGRHARARTRSFGVRAGMRGQKTRCSTSPIWDNARKNPSRGEEEEEIGMGL